MTIVAALAAALALPPLPAWAGRALGTLSADVVGFARLPGLGRCALTADQRASYVAGGRLRHRRAEFPYWTPSARRDFGDLDGDGTDEMVAVSPEGEISEHAWTGTGYALRSRVPLPSGYRYGEPLLVPRADGRRAWLLALRSPKADGSPLPDAIAAFRKVGARWERVWERPTFGEAGLPLGPNWIEWEGAYAGRALLATTAGDFPYARERACIRIGPRGFSVLWSARERIVEGKAGTRVVTRRPGESGPLAVADAHYGVDPRLHRTELASWAGNSLRPLATVPSTGWAWWETKPGTGYLVAGRRVLASAADSRPVRRRSLARLSR